jgi:hypothetical protein
MFAATASGMEHCRLATMPVEVGSLTCSLSDRAFPGSGARLAARHRRGGGRPGPAMSIYLPRFSWSSSVSADG